MMGPCALDDVASKSNPIIDANDLPRNGLPQQGA
jgi:hypothetical protein